MTEPNDLEINNGCPTITLGGVDWPIPMLAIRQLRLITPIITRYYKRFSNLSGDMESVKTQIASEFDDEMVTDLIAIVYIGLTRAHPELSKDEFEDMPISLIELRDAVQVVVSQTGVFAPVEANQKKMVNSKAKTPKASIGIQ